MMNRKIARQLIKKLAKLHVKQWLPKLQLEKEIFDGFVLDTSPTPTPEQIFDSYEKFLEESNPKEDYTIVEKNDPDAFEKILNAFMTCHIIDEKDITNEFCDSLIEAIQKHFAGVVISDAFCGAGSKH